MSSWYSTIIPRRVSSVKHQRHSSPSSLVCRITHSVSAVKQSVNSGRPFVSCSSIMRMEQSASCCQRHAVAAVFPLAFKDISVSVIIPLLTFMLRSALYFQSVSATDYVKCPCNNFIKRHFNQYFVNNNNRVLFYFKKIIMF